ncbi:MAG: response regulator [Christensenellales bacterium]
MYSVLLVDDEPLAIQSLGYIIQKNFSDIKVCGKARSGREAIETVRQARPDIIVMDIHMPGINGLTAMQQIRSLHPDARFVVVSAFSYFDFAKEAIELNVDAYLLKPVRENQFIETLERITQKILTQRELSFNALEMKEKLEISRPVLEFGFINALCLPEDNISEIKAYSDVLDIDCKAGGYVIVIEFTENGTVEDEQKLWYLCQDIIKSIVDCVSGRAILNRIVVFIPGCPDKNVPDKAAAKLTAKQIFTRIKTIKPNICIGIGRCYQSVTDSGRSYREALRALRNRLPMQGGIIHIDDVTNNTDETKEHYADMFEQQVFGPVEDGNICEAVTVFEDIFGQLCNQYMPNIEMIKVRVISFFMDIVKREGCSVKKDGLLLETILSAADTNQLQSACFRYLEDIIERILSGRNKRTHALVQKANEYIEQLYTEEITLEDIAGAVNLSPYYFSRFYKEQTGVNFIDKLTAVRIEHAKKYLTRSQYSVKEVCHLVGYSDPNYFSKLFKKNVGMNASEYKERYGK